MAVEIAHSFPRGAACPAGQDSSSPDARHERTEDLEYDRLADGDRANLQEFLTFLQLVMPAIGCPRYSFPDAITHRVSAPAIDMPEALAPMGLVHFELEKDPARAIAYLKDGSFWICRGSTARVEEKLSLREGYRQSRRKLLDKGVLIHDPQRNVLVFTRDVPFDSPSDAAAVVGTTSLNGRKEWKIAGTRKSYDEWEREAHRSRE